MSYFSINVLLVTLVIFQLADVITPSFLQRSLGERFKRQRSNEKSGSICQQYPSLCQTILSEINRHLNQQDSGDKTDTIDDSDSSEEEEDTTLTENKKISELPNENNPNITKNTSGNLVDDTKLFTANVTPPLVKSDDLDKQDIFGAPQENSNGGANNKKNQSKDAKDKQATSHSKNNGRTGKGHTVTLSENKVNPDSAKKRVYLQPLEDVEEPAEKKMSEHIKY
ncbi:uncharacterized protein LOC130626178 [Hydractinia symbiolongicarpus]|uniref:uncharacterized protein LOC130626178 n=1 Tax=Hydractinia symbiolongicarpus TaxID=13093 RepID=UPI00254F99EF|nr:uncharacterized protein LOC130626178 [Hydractinia symbiolongicarpus]